MEQKLVHKNLHIEGMTCASCERRIESKLNNLEGIVEANASFGNSNVHVTYDSNTVGLDTIIHTIEELNYKVKDKRGNGTVTSNERKERVHEDKLTINQLLGIGIILFAIYTIIKNTIGFNFIPQINQNMGYGILFVVGLITSFHCIAMCGGINLSQCISHKEGLGDTSKMSKLKPSLLYNGGRIISYTIIGGLVGALGSAVSFSGAAKGSIAILSGVFMVIMGLNMLNIFPWLRKLNPRIPKVFSNKIHNGNTNRGPFYVGLLNGLMPCGPLQAMQIYALGTGSFYAGALSMFVFSLGTVPLMFGFGVISYFLSGKFTSKMMKVSAVLVVVLGMIMISRGLNLSGVSPSYASKASGSVAKIEGNVQTVTTSLESGRYQAIVVQKGIPVKWIFKATAEDLNGCNGAITIPKYNIEKELKPGDNIIEFTPTEVGKIKYTCWMGMISSNITVVDEVNNVTPGSIDTGNDRPVRGGCCGG